MRDVPFQHNQFDILLHLYGTVFVCLDTMPYCFSTALKFEVLKREDVELQSHIQVVATKMYKDEQRTPVPFSALDRRLVSNNMGHDEYFAGING